MRRPVWASAPGFTRAWSALEYQGNEFSRSIMNLMQVARVIAVKPAQVNVLPNLFNDDKFRKRAYENLAEFMHGCVLPFDTIFVDTLGSDLEGYRDGSICIGALLMQTELGVTGLGFGATQSRTFAPVMMVNPMSASAIGVNKDESDFYRGFIDLSGQALKPDASKAREDDMTLLTTWSKDFHETALSLSAEDKRTLMENHIDQVERALAVIAMLQSANVYLDEVELSRNERKRAARKNQQVPLTVKVMQRSRRQRKSDESAHVDYSHRFEVAGNYAHHFAQTAEGTPNKLFEKWKRDKPEKVMMIGGRECIRIWRPPYVKGPEDKPLVVKARVVE
jgi:hypothetical protein